MARSFAITTAAPAVRLSASRRAEARFTVTNALGRPVRLRALVEPEGQTRPEWLRLAGDAEQDLGPDGTLQLAVQAVVPPDAPAGRYAFHLVVVDVVNPDEVYAAGPP